MTFVIDGYNHLNPITQVMFIELYEELERFDRDRDLRVGLICGAGDQHFSVGGDLKRVSAAAASVYDPSSVVDHYWNPYSRDPSEMLGANRRLARFQTTKPVIAAVEGYCLGAALTLLGQQSDVRVAGEGAKFGFAELKHGMGGGAAVRSRLRDQIPYTSLMWLVTTGLSIDAAEARRIGLINEVVSNGGARERAVEIARIMAALPPIAVRSEKYSLTQTHNVPFGQAIAVAEAHDALGKVSSEPREGLTTFVAEQPPGAAE